MRFVLFTDTDGKSVYINADHVRMVRAGLPGNTTIVFDRDHHCHLVSEPDEALARLESSAATHNRASDKRLGRLHSVGGREDRHG